MQNWHRINLCPEYGLGLMRNCKALVSMEDGFTLLGHGQLPPASRRTLGGSHHSGRVWPLPILRALARTRLEQSSGERVGP